MVWGSAAEVEFESEEDEEEGMIIAGGNKAGSGEGFFVFSTPIFIEIGGLRRLLVKDTGASMM